MIAITRIIAKPIARGGTIRRRVRIIVKTRRTRRITMMVNSSPDYDCIILAQRSPAAVAQLLQAASQAMLAASHLRRAKARASPESRGRPLQVEDHIQVCTCRYMYMYMYMYVYMYMYMYTRMCLHTNICIYIQIHKCIYMRAYGYA